MSKLIAATFALALAGATLAAPAALAAEPAKAEAASKKKAAKAKETKEAKEPKAKAARTAKGGKAKPVVASTEADPEADEPDIADTAVSDFNCELGNKVTIYQNATDDGHIALRWKKRLHRLTRVATTTGAQRFENKMYGLIWIGIPAKAMLLDSKQNRQLANECKNDEQSRPQPAPEVQAVTPAPTGAPIVQGATPAPAAAAAPHG